MTSGQGTSLHPRPEKHRFGRWLIAILVLIAFGVLDMAVVALPTQAASPSQIATGVVTFVVIALGVIYTVWKMEQTGK